MVIYRTNKKGAKSKIQLTRSELSSAYEEQQHIYDKSDIRNRLDTDREYYVEKFGIDKARVTKDEIEEMACRLRQMLNCDADATWSSCVHSAIEIVLSKRGTNQ